MVNSHSYRELKALCSAVPSWEVPEALAALEKTRKIRECCLYCPKQEDRKEQWKLWFGALVRTESFSHFEIINLFGNPSLEVRGQSYTYPAVPLHKSSWHKRWKRTPVILSCSKRHFRISLSAVTLRTGEGAHGCTRNYTSEQPTFCFTCDWEELCRVMAMKTLKYFLHFQWSLKNIPSILLFFLFFLCACLSVNAYAKNHRGTALKTPIHKSGLSFLDIHMQAHFRVIIRQEKCPFFLLKKAKQGPWCAGRQDQTEAVGAAWRSQSWLPSGMTDGVCQEDRDLPSYFTMEI